MGVLQKVATSVLITNVTLVLLGVFVCFGLVDCSSTTVILSCEELVIVSSHALVVFGRRLALHGSA